MVMALLQDEEELSEDSDVEAYIAAYDDDEVDYSDEGDQEDDESYYMAAIADHLAAAVSPEVSKKLPCYRYFRAGVSGCAAGDKCKFSHDTGNAEMQALYVRASRNKRPGDTQRGHASRAGHRSERHHRRDDNHRRGTRRDHRS